MQNTTMIGFQLDAIIKFLLSPLGLLLLLAIPVFVALTVISNPARWIALALLLWISTFGAFVDQIYFKSTLMFPFQDLRQIAKPLCIIAMILLLPAVAFSSSSQKSKGPSGASWAYFIFLLIIGLRIITTGLLDRGLTQIITCALTFLVFGVGLSRWMHDVEDVRRGLKCITWAAVLLVVGSLAQAVVDSKQAMMTGRFLGTTPNPQFLGSAMGLCITPALCLLMQSAESKIWRITLAGTIGFMIVCLVWAGSRSGALCAALNVLLFFRLRLGKLFVAAIIIAVSLWIASQFFSDSFIGADRLLSTDDTRSASWATMLAAFLRNPFLGAIDEGFGYAENAYLAVASQFGLLGVLPGLVLVVLVINMLRKLLAVRSQLGAAAPYCDVIFSGLISYGVICMFDAYPLAIIGFHVFYLYVYFAIGGLLLEIAAQQRALAHAPVYAPQEELLPQLGYDSAW
jgi:FtsH-binding integral membrane protein